jgi:glycosyltransferase involved in cell wall biosynthesis
MVMVGVKLMSLRLVGETTGSHSVRLAQTGRLKRVLYVLDLNPADKFPTVAEHGLVLAREFRDRGSLFLPVYRPPLHDDLVNRHAEHRISVEGLDLRTLRVATLRRLLQLIRENRIEIVHWNFYNPLVNGYLWALTVLAPRVAHFYTDHISRPAGNVPRSVTTTLKGIVKRPLSLRYRKTLCISEFVKRELQKHHWPNLQVVYNFVNTERFRPDLDRRREVRNSLGTGKEFVALGVAYLIEDKGIAVAVRAMAELPAKVVLWVVGDGPERGNLEALASAIGVGHRVRFLGSPKDIVPFMQAADCFVCPSIWNEGAGAVNFEAMACGLPDIASEVGGIPEIVEDGRNGFLFTPGDQRGLAERIRRLCEAPQLRDWMGSEARSTVVERYSTQSLLAEHLRVYQVGQSS